VISPGSVPRRRQLRRRLERFTAVVVIGLGLRIAVEHC